jgi:peptidyl-prolyl cis-trans isomerase SurA
MRDQVGRKIAPTPGEIQLYFDAHKQEYAQPESVKLGEILIATGTAPEDQQKLADAKAKTDDIEARLHAGGDFTQLARSFSEGTTAAAGGDLGQYKRGQLDKLFEDKTFALKTGEYTEPIRTKQGFVILKVIQHIPGGIPEFKDVEPDVEQAYFMAKMDPANRAYLAKLRDEAAIYIKPGYEDSGSTASEKHPSITFSAYTPPSSKKKKKVERTRFRETTRTFRQKSAQQPSADQATAAPAAKPSKASKKSSKTTDQASMKPGKKEKIRFGKAPQQTLPTAPSAATEDAGAPASQVAANAAAEPDNPLENTAKPEKKSRFSERAKLPKQPKSKGLQLDPDAPPPPDAAEVADQQSQAGPLGLGGNTTTTKKKKKATTTGDKTRLSNKKKTETEEPAAGQAPLGPAPQSTPAQVPTPPAPVSPDPTPPPQR